MMSQAVFHSVESHCDNAQSGNLKSFPCTCRFITLTHVNNINFSAGSLHFVTAFSFNSRQPLEGGKRALNLCTMDNTPSDNIHLLRGAVICAEVESTESSVNSFGLKNVSRRFALFHVRVRY